MAAKKRARDIIENGTCTVCGETSVDGRHQCKVAAEVLVTFVGVLATFDALSNAQRADIMYECGRIADYTKSRAAVRKELEPLEALDMERAADAWRSLQQLLGAMNQARRS